MKLIRTKDAEGHVLCHDITQIIPGKYKGARFKKGHVVRAEDIPLLLSIGKENLYVWENDPGKLHENEAANILYDLCAGENIKPTEVREGKIEGIALADGILKINTKLLEKINSLGEMMIAARYHNLPVRKGEKLFGTRVIPLVIDKSRMEEAKKICGDEKIISLLPYKKKRAGIVTTGSEIFKGLIRDASFPVLKGKLEEYGGEISGQIITDDDSKNTEEAIMRHIREGADLVLCSGGMSVDPDDRTPLAIRNTGAEVISYGAPVLPGAMFMLAYYHQKKRSVPIVGLPGCVMYAKRTIFDLVLPRLVSDDPVSAKELARLGKGGLCLSCDPCHYPNCQFGKGW
ncbi:MAG: molybdopterin-binding protein [Johnsonella sp.]|nr:molybdopterin-binding protein [Johnsonella sp.]